MSDWSRAERAIHSMHERLITATTEEDFQGIGHLGREALISIAQATQIAFEAVAGVVHPNESRECHNRRHREIRG
jgi:L-amino acid N-acyltransferase YncA